MPWTECSVAKLNPILHFLFLLNFLLVFACVPKKKLAYLFSYHAQMAVDLYDIFVSCVP